MKTWILAIVAMAMLAAGSATADAGDGLVGIYYGRAGAGRAPHSSHYSYNRGFYGGPRTAFRFSYNGGGARYGSGYGGGGYGHQSHHGHGGHGSWHDTSHYDYHPGGYVRHYDHYDYVPGHYDFHQEGHWDHH